MTSQKSVCEGGYRCNTHQCCRFCAKDKIENVNRVLFPFENECAWVTSSGIDHTDFCYGSIHCRYLYHVNGEFSVYFYSFTITFRQFTSFSLYLQEFQSRNISLA